MMKDMTGVDRSSYANNAAMAEMAFDLTRVGSGLVDASQKAAQALLATRIPVDGENTETTPGGDLTKPLLSPPSGARVKEMHGSAKLTQLLGELNAMLGEVGQSQLEGRIALFRSMADARQKSLEKVSKEFEAAVNVTEESVALYETTQAQTAAAQAKFDSAQQQASAAEMELASLENDDPARPQVLLKNEVAQKVLLAATQKLNGAVENEKRLSGDVFQKLKIATDIETRSNAATALTPAKQNELQQLSNSTARLSLLMAALTQMIGDGSEAGMKNDQALFKDMQAKRQKVLEKSAADYEAEVRKAEQVSKTMACIGKIVGAILTVVSIVAIPFTGGASAALAVIGVGLMLADAVTTAITGGTSLTDMAMAPIMTKVIQPLIEKLSKKIIAALENAGMSKEKAQLVGSIVAAVAVAIAMLFVVIAVAVTAKGAAGKLIEKFAKPMVKMLSKMTAKVTQNMSRSTVKRVNSVATTTGAVISTAGTATQAGGGVAVGVYTKRADDFEADIVLSSNTLQQLERYLRDAGEKFSEIIRTQQQLTIVASDAMQRQLDVGRFVLRRTHA